jgi:uncharacterized membrane protein YfcA
MALDLSIWGWGLALLCGLMVGMAKTGVAGLGTLVVPIMAYIFGGMPSAGLLLPMLVMADIFGVSFYHRSAQWKYIFKLMPWAFLGIILGLLVGKSISSVQFKQLIGILVIISLAVMVWQEFSGKEKNTPQQWWHAAIFGIAGGFSTMIGNAAGPIMSVYLISMGLPKNNFIGTAAWFFMIINVFKVPLQIWVWHNITLQSLSFNLMLLPAIAIGAFVGILIVKRITDKSYRWFVMFATLFSAIMLLV